MWVYALWVKRKENRLCAGNDVSVLMGFAPACSGPQFLLPFLLPVPFIFHKSIGAALEL